MKILRRILLGFFFILGYLGWFTSASKCRLLFGALHQQTAQVQSGLSLIVAERDAMQKEILRLHQEILCQLVNNEEILAAARAGDLERAHKLHDKAMRLK
jgi:cell division protein FtsB